MPPLDLPSAWLRLARDVGGVGDLAGEGARLLAAYAAKGRAYHGLQHLAEVLAHVDELEVVALDPDAVRLAAWFHDARYDPTRDDNEEVSAELAARSLGRLAVPARVTAEVGRLVRLTARHDPGPGDRDGAVLCDADLAVLAREPDGYARYVDGIRAEYAHLSEAEWRTGRAAVLRRLLDRPAVYATEPGRRRWEAGARANLERELAALG